MSDIRINGTIYNHLLLSMVKLLQQIYFATNPVCERIKFSLALLIVPTWIMGIFIVLSFGIDYFTGLLLKGSTGVF